MRNKSLWRTVLIVNFAKDATRPFANALFRILLGYGVAIMVGRLLVKALYNVELPSSLPLLVGVCLSVAIGFILGGLMQLTMTASKVGKGAAINLQRTLQLLPLSRRTRWIIKVGPGIIVMSMVCLGGVQVVYAAGLRLLSQPLVLCTSWGMGLLSGYGLTLMPWPRTWLLKGLLYVTTLSAGLKLFDFALNSAVQYWQNVGLWGTIGLFLVPLVGFIHAYYQRGAQQLVIKNMEERPLIPRYIPVSGWFLIKLWRNMRTRNSLLLALALSLLLSTGLHLRHSVVSDPYSLLLMSGMLAATFAGDVRGVMRRHAPPEIILIKGAKGIVWSELGAVILCGLIIGLPLLFVLHSFAESSIAFALFYGCLQTFCAAAGLLASTLLVPGAGETGTQFFTGALATALLVVFPKFAGLSDVAYVDQSKYWLIAGLCLAGGVYGIELIRRRNYGRT